MIRTAIRQPWRRLLDVVKFTSTKMTTLNFYTDMCPCGSGMLLKDCCLTRRHDTAPPGPITGYANPRCYARALRDCNTKISGEHFISNSILGLYDGAGELTVEGFPWLNTGGQRRIQRAALTANMLCTRHNSALSSLDSTASRFFGFLIGKYKGTCENILLITGKEIERWMLKTLCGIVASGNVVHDSKRIRRWEPPLQWLDILFDVKQIPDGCGLHYIIGKYRYADKRIDMNTVKNTTTGEIVALTFAVAGLPFLFAIEPPPPRQEPTPSGAELRFHPKVLQVRSGNELRELHFGWPEGCFVVVELGEK